MFRKLTEFFVKNNVISNASGFIIALNLSEFINSLVKDILIPGLLPFKEQNPLFSFFASLVSLILVVFIVYLLLGEFATRTLGVERVENQEKVKETIQEKIVEKQVEKNPELMEEIVKEKMGQE